jgi:Ni,Fe-hydrogenase III large subunit
MRDILEALPGALFPDLQKESDDPGVESALLGDDLVRPAAEDELPHIHRGRKSPLSRTLVHTIDPLERALPLPVGLRLGLEGARVTDVVVDTGYTHQGIERRALGLSVVEPLPLLRLAARCAPGVVAQLGVAIALERGASVVVDDSVTAARGVALDVVCVADALHVLAHPALSHETRALADAAATAGALVDAVVAGDAYAAVGGLRRVLAREERATVLRLLDDVERPLVHAQPERLFAHLAGVGRLDERAAREKGVDGPALRAAGGVDDDACVDCAAPVAAPTGRAGDVVARLSTRRADALAAIARLRQRLSDVDSIDGADGAIAAAVDVKDGIHVAAVRGPGGVLAVLVAVRGGAVERLRLRPPDLALIAALPRALAGVALDDAAAVIASFGVHISAVDR